MPSVGDDFPREQARCRELLKTYHDLGRAGVFGAAMIEAVLARADKAVIGGDLAEILISYREMRECE